jgi:hypothetical protein
MFEHVHLKPPLSWQTLDRFHPVSESGLTSDDCYAPGIRLLARGRLEHGPEGFEQGCERWNDERREQS